MDSGALKALLRAARSDNAEVKLGTLRALVGIANVGDNLSQVVRSGLPIYLLSCTYCQAEMQLNVARCFENFLDQVFQGTHFLSEEEARMVFETCGLEVNRERVRESDAMDLDVSLTKHTHAAAPGLTSDWIANVALMSKAPTEEIVRAAQRLSSLAI